MDTEGIAFVAAKAEPAKGKADTKKDAKKGGKGAAPAPTSVKEEKKGGLALFGGMSALEVIGAPTRDDDGVTCVILCPIPCGRHGPRVR